MHRWLVPLVILGLYGCASMPPAASPLLLSPSTVPASPAVELAPDYVARAERARFRAQEAQDAAERSHESRLAELWLQAAALESERIREDRHRARLSARREVLRENLLSLQARPTASSLGVEAAQARLASAYGALLNVDPGTPPVRLSASLAEALRTVVGLVELWLLAAEDRGLDPGLRAATSTAVADAWKALAARAPRSRVVLAEVRRAVSQGENLLGHLKLSARSLPAAATLRGLAARVDDQGGVEVVLPAELFAPGTAQLSNQGRRALQAGQALLRVYGHLQPVLRSPVGQAEGPPERAQRLRRLLSDLPIAPGEARGEAYCLYFARSVAVTR